jgi:amino acid permease
MSHVLSAPVKKIYFVVARCSRTLLERADSLRYTSAISILLAVVFMLISLGIAVYALFTGTATMPRMLPDFSRLSSPFELFTAVPVIVVAFTFHFNGTHFFSTIATIFVQGLCADYLTRTNARPLAT